VQCIAAHVPTDKLWRVQRAAYAALAADDSTATGLVNKTAFGKIAISVYWASYKKGRLELALSDWSEVELNYNCEKQSFTISEVKLGGI
jgi:hypothetical protein